MKVYNAADETAYNENFKLWRNLDLEKFYNNQITKRACLAAF